MGISSTSVIAGTPEGNCGMEPQELAWGLSLADDGAPIAFSSFVDEVQGTYRIELANSKKPKPENEEGEVARDGGEGLFTLPYCESGGVCDPGYLFFPIDRTRAFKKTLSPNHKVVTLLLEDAGRTLRYTWDNQGGRITFRNYQYRLHNGAVITMEHIMRKP